MVRGISKGISTLVKVIMVLMIFVFIGMAIIASWDRPARTWFYLMITVGVIVWGLSLVILRDKPDSLAGATVFFFVYLMATGFLLLGIDGYNPNYLFFLMATIMYLIVIAGINHHIVFYKR